MTNRYHRLKAMEECVSDALKSSFQSHQKQDQQLFLHWRKIVGDEFAKMATPQKISRGKGAQSCLILGTKTGASTLMMQHLSVQLIETINGYFGYKYLDRVQFEPARSVDLPKPYKREKFPLPKVDLSDVKEALDHVCDDDLKSVLSRMGETLHIRSKES